MNILITGAGLIGCHSAKRLLEKGNRVVLYDIFPDRDYIHAIAGEATGLIAEGGDMRDLPALFSLVRKYAVDTIVHTAGLIGKKVAEHPYTGFTVNVQGSMNVAEVVRVMEVKRLVFISSFGAYNWDAAVQKRVTEDFPLGGSGLYGATKAANEHLLGALADLGGFELIILRPAAVFGRGHYRGGSSVGILMHELIEGAKGGEIVRLPEARLGMNEYVYAKDVAQATEKACTVSSVKSRAFNVGTGIIHSAQDVVHKICALIPGARIELIPPAKGEEIRYRGQPLDISRARTELGYEPEYSLETALADYII